MYVFFIMHIYIYICIHAYTHQSIRKYACMFVCMSESLDVYVFIHMDTCKSLFICLFMCIYICLCVYLFTFIIDTCSTLVNAHNVESSKDPRNPHSNFWSLV